MSCRRTDDDWHTTPMRPDVTRSICRNFLTAESGYRYRPTGRLARWSRDGKELYFREGDKLMTVSLQGAAVGRPAVLFEKRFQGYDVGTDGRFLAAIPDEKAPPVPVNVVLNWLPELRRLVPPSGSSRK